MKTRRQFLDVLKDYDTWKDVPNPGFCARLAGVADQAYAKRTVEGYLAALVIYHQLCDEMLRILIEKSHFLLQCAVFPQMMEDIDLDKGMMFGTLVREYERTVRVDESVEFIAKCKELNLVRNRSVHRITREPSIRSAAGQARRCKRLFEDIYDLYETIHDILRDGIGDYKKMMEDDNWQEWVDELKPKQKPARPNKQVKGKQ
jgi:hypothetical protein